MSLADHADNRRQTTITTITTITSRYNLCEINAACCIPLRYLRYLRENNHAKVLNLSAQRNPNTSPVDYADSRRQQPL